jgi:hypothetical protein
MFLNTPAKAASVGGFFHWISRRRLHMIVRRPIRFTPGPHIRTLLLPGRFPKPRFRCVEVCKHLDVVDVADLLARIHVNEHGHLTILWCLVRSWRGAGAGSGSPWFSALDMAMRAIMTMPPRDQAFRGSLPMLALGFGRWQRQNINAGISQASKLAVACRIGSKKWRDQPVCSPSVPGKLLTGIQNKTAAQHFAASA